jgi:hypothetical protein
MTEAQWLWEFLALQEKESQQIDLVTEVLKATKKMLTKLLGLDLVKEAMTEEELKEAGDDIAIPFALIAGRREFIQHIMEKVENKSKVAKAMTDTDFDAMSAAIAKGEIGDMDPILDTSDVERILASARQKELKDVGITIVDSVNKNVPHISLDIGKIKERQQQITDIYDKAKDRSSKRGLKVAMDDNDG